MFKTICVLAVVLLACHQYEAVPTGQHKSITEMSQAELMHKFEKFMNDDKEAAQIRSLYEKEMAAHKLHKRQTELDAPDMDVDVMQAGQEGFLDRAAKFVLELVQRFLKWINTE